MRFVFNFAFISEVIYAFLVRICIFLHKKSCQVFERNNSSFYYFEVGLLMSKGQSFGALMGAIKDKGLDYVPCKGSVFRKKSHLRLDCFD